MIGKILIVDDETSSLTLLHTLLTAEGHQVRPFNNSELALRSIMFEAPELILSDIRMPGMNGFELCRHIKADEYLKDIPIIFISAASDMSDKIQAFREGGVDYITKPYQKEEVVARVNTHIALSHTIQRMKKFAEIIQMSESSLKMAQAVAHLGYWEWNIIDNQFVCSDEMYKILGLNESNLIVTQNDFLQTVHPMDREYVAECLQKFLNGVNFDIEYRIILPDGKIRIIHGKGEVLNVDVNKQIKNITNIPQIYRPDQITRLGVIQDITEQKELQQKLEEQANTDYLTGCSSRRYFLEQAEQEILRFHRYGVYMSVLMLDLDHFKKINDTYGHPAGDIILKEMVQICRTNLRDVDMLGRLGGEEFAISLPATNNERAIEVANRLCNAIAILKVYTEGNPPIQFTVSIGVACPLISDLHIDNVIKRADKALYQAKQTGRNKVCNYDETII